MNILLIFAIILSLLTSFTWMLYVDLYLRTATSITGERDGKHIEKRDAIILAVIHIAFSVCSAIWFPFVWVYVLALIAMIILQLVNKQGALRMYANDFIAFTYVVLLFIAVAVAADKGKKAGVGMIILYVLLSILAFIAGVIKTKWHGRVPKVKTKKDHKKLDGGEIIAIVALAIVGIVLIAGIVYIAVNYL